jgi:hypothetical protein
MVVQVQKEGWLYKRPFTGSQKGAWQKRYFVLKDSFLFWYEKKDKDSNFNIFPKGVLPVGGAQAFPLGKEGNDYIFEVTHADFQHSMFLKSSDKNDVDDWISVLVDCRKATYSNAVLGNALLDRMKSVGTAVEKEKQKALEDLQKQAEELEAERERKWKMMMEHMEAQRAHDAQVNSKVLEQQKAQEEMEEVAQKVEEARLAKLTEEQLAEEAKTQLALAKEQLTVLTSMINAKRSQIDEDPELAAKVNKAMETIQAFFAQ